MKIEIDFGETIPCGFCDGHMVLLSAMSHRNEVDTSSWYQSHRRVMELPKEKIVLIFKCRCGVRFARDMKV